MFCFAGRALIVILAIGIALPACGPSSGASSAGRPSEEELRKITQQIFTTCQIRVLGRSQREGERISSAEAGAITTCVDQMGAAYIEGVKAGRK